MDKVQANSPGATRVPASVDVARTDSAKAVSQSKSQAQETQKAPETSSPQRSSGKQLPVDASQRLEAAAAADRQQVEEAANKVNEYAKGQQREVRFSVDQELGLPVVKVVDSSRDVVVRQIPSEVVIRLARNLEEYMEYSEMSGASAPADSDVLAGSNSSVDKSGLAQGIEPGHLINTNV